MRKMFRFAVAAAVITAGLAPTATAGAPGKDIVDFGTPGGSSITVAGCQPKGLWAIPATVGGGLADGTYFYAVTAVTSGGESVSCGPFPVTVAGAQDAAILMWNNTLGATSYNVYRGPSPGALGLRGSVAAGACTTPASNPRCPFVDAGGAAPGTGPAFAATTSAANSHPDFKIVETINYDADPEELPPNDSNPPALKTDLIHFPPGLLSNPLATRDGSGNLVRCTLANPGGPSLLGDPAPVPLGSDDPNEDTCPRAALVGTVQVLAFTRTGAPPGTPTPTLIQGDIYNGVPLGLEAGRLFVVLRPPCSAGHPAPLDPGGAACTSILGSPFAQVEKSFLGAKANVVLRGDGTYGIDVDTFDVKSGADAPLSRTSRVLAGPPGSLVVAAETPTQVRMLTQDLFGSADQGTEGTSDDRPFVTLPTSCSAKTLSADATFWVDATVFSGSALFTPTACDAVPFAPKVVGTIGGAGNSGEGRHPEIDVTITQATGESATRKAAVTLPPLFGVSLDALANTCTEANLQANACAAGATVGSATATSELLPVPLSGPVILVGQPGALPKLSVLLVAGATTVRLDGQVSIVNGGLVNTFDPVPELPLSSFRLTLKGGQGGLLQNSADLCKGTGSLHGEFTGYNGANVAVDAPLTPVGVPACAAAAAKKPKAKLTLKGLGSGEPVLSMNVRRGSTADASDLTRVKLLLPKGLRADTGEKSSLKVNASKRLKGGSLTLRKRSLVVKKLPGGDSPRVKAKFPKGTLKASRSLAKKGKGTRLTFRLRVKVAGGKTFKVKVKVKAKS